MDRIRRRDFIGWTGLPAGCTPADLGARGDPSEWALRPLGESFERVAFQPLELDGYVSPKVNVRGGRVVLFDATHPELGDYPALMADLGAPEARLDYAFGFLELPAAEWVYASRGITAFVNTDRDRLLHIALYAPTDVAGYRARLRPDLRKRRLKRR